MVMQIDEVKFNGRERAGDRRRVFVCRLTDGRLAAIAEGVAENAPLRYFATVNDVKQQVAIMLPDVRIPVYDSYEIPDVVRRLNALASGATA